ncbi:DMT family transporter [Cyanobium sp. ATX-6F1]
MTLGALAALAAALCWTLSTSLWRRLPTSLGAAQLNLLKNLLALALLGPALLLFPGVVPAPLLLPLALSGVVGIGLGDSLFFAALRRLGTRRTLTLEAGGPAFTALVGALVLAEVPRPLQWLGIGLISLAVLLVARGAPPQRPDQALGLGPDRWGVSLALGALACGSAGALLARSALVAGTVDPLQSAAVRLAAASLVLLPLLRTWPRPGQRPWPAPARWPLVLLATLLGTSAGIVLQQTALQLLPGAGGGPDGHGTGDGLAPGVPGRGPAGEAGAGGGPAGAGGRQFGGGPMGLEGDGRWQLPQPRLGLPLRPGHQLAQLQGQGITTQLGGQPLQLGGAAQQLLQEHRGEVGIALEPRLAGHPGFDRLAGRHGALVGRTDLLQTAQAVGQQAQVVAFQCRQQASLQQRQVI